MANQNVSAKNFENCQFLGSGTYGAVYLVRKNGGSDDKKFYAMKMQEKVNVKSLEKGVQRAWTELEILKSVRNVPYIVQLQYAFHSASSLYLVLEYVKGRSLELHLQDRFGKNGPFVENTVRIWSAQLVLALEELHKRHIIHRDIHPGNILLDDQSHVVLIDFGLSRKFPYHDKELKAHSVCGYTVYRAPEMLEKRAYDFGVDVWALGVLIYELMTGQTPVFAPKRGKSAIMRLDDTKNPNKVLVIPDYLSVEMKALLGYLLVRDPNERPKISAVKQHPFYASISWEDLRARRVAVQFKGNDEYKHASSKHCVDFFMKKAKNDEPLADDDPFNGYYFDGSFSFSELSQTVSVEPTETH